MSFPRNNQTARFKWLSSAIFVGIAVFGSSCKMLKPTHPSLSERPPHTTSNDGMSAQIPMGSGGELNLCLQVTPDPNNVRPVNHNETFKTLVRLAALQWLSSINVAPQPGAAATSLADTTVNVIDQNICNNGRQEVPGRPGHFFDGIVEISPVQRAFVETQVIPRAYIYENAGNSFFCTMVHEAGHMFGLDDRYRKDNQGIPKHPPECVDQQPSIMCTLRNDPTDADFETFAGVLRDVFSRQLGSGAVQPQVTVQKLSAIAESPALNQVILNTVNFNLLGQAAIDNAIANLSAEARQNQIDTFRAAYFTCNGNIGAMENNPAANANQVMPDNPEAKP